MNQLEVAKFLTAVSAIDNRTVKPEQVYAWLPMLLDVTVDEAGEAMRMHYQDSDAYLQPAHVRANVQVIRRRRERDLRIQQSLTPEPRETGDPCPKCEHGLSLWACLPCAKALGGQE
jgi:hypothetical protein